MRGRKMREREREKHLLALVLDCWMLNMCSLSNNNNNTTATTTNSSNSQRCLLASARTQLLRGGVPSHAFGLKSGNRFLLGAFCLRDPVILDLNVQSGTRLCLPHP